MFEKLRRSLYVKVTATVILVLVVVMGLFTYFQLQKEERSLQSKLSQETNQLSTVLAAALHNAMVSADQAGLESMVEKVGTINTVKQVYILAADGKVFKSSDKTKPAKY